MSYDIHLCDSVTRETLETEVPHMMRGGTYVTGGTTKMWLNVTYNYWHWYHNSCVFGEKGIRSIYGMTGAESIPVLKKAISGLRSLDEDMTEEEIRDFIEHGVTGYWLPTRENAIKPLCQLLAFAQMRPDGIWRGD